MHDLLDDLLTQAQNAAAPEACPADGQQEPYELQERHNASNVRQTALQDDVPVLGNSQRATQQASVAGLNLASATLCNS